ncbi:cytochrome b/b6 domain-containing protein [Methylocystis sp. B8]|uniref:cytochrome b/b6 domain-containing protein n=1 Tax=Methylocystis sp. B8 TaxID=544938 RepID=UPI0010FF39F6|nr:cytochrome b/b6 domain-containing protein [Methylocystis sp. B8]TLG71863.1 cytochrome B [Methylocystis sp. B8]
MLAKLHRERDGVARRPTKVFVWDPIVRLFHWTVVLGCLADLYVFEEGGRLHRWVGYLVALALIVRVIWGVVGSKHARFTDFVPRPSNFSRYVAARFRGEEQRFLGHNPAGAVMMLSLMGLLVAVSVTGWMLTLDGFFGSQSLEDIHEAIANSILILAGAHACAALLESWRHRENLVLSMITGYKRA